MSEPFLFLDRRMRKRCHANTAASCRGRFELLEPRVVLNGGPIINELLAINQRSWQDYDDDWTDWFEIANTSDSQLDLEGYYVTDDAARLQKWQVPVPTLLDPGEFLVVFASGKDFVAPTGELNTNFKLDGGGEYLALVEPDGQTIAWEVTSEAGSGFPAQWEDISYGVATSTVAVPLVAADAEIEYLVPASAEALSADWKEADFTDPAGVWTASAGGNGVGFETDGDELSEFIQTDLAGVMHGQNSSAFVRAEFEVPAGLSLDDLTLRVRYADGFVAYLNGTEVARRNAPENPAWDSAATGEREDAEAAQLEEIPLTVGRLLSDLHTVKDNTFMVDLPSGVYDVTVRQGDLTRLRDEMAIFLEQMLVDTVTTQQGEIVSNTYRVQVTDGQLSLQLKDQGGTTGRSVINGLVITPVDAGEAASTLTLDFGTLTSPQQPGALQVHGGRLYSQAVGYGWLDPDFIPVVRASEVDNLELIQAGANVLAFQGLNSSAASPNFLLQVELTGTRLQVEAGQIGYHLEPTPGEPNSALFASRVATPVEYSVAGGTFTEDFTLSLSTDVPGGVIHYTVDQTVPTGRSEAFDPALPISVTNTTQVRTRVVAPGHLPSPVVSQTYIKVAADLLEFRSQLPLVVLDNFGAGEFVKTPAIIEDTYFAIFEPQGEHGLSSLLDQPHLQTRAGAKVRGSSSIRSPKNSYAVEAWDEKDQDRDIAPLGLPADSDWILSGRRDYDRSLMRNPFVYELGNQMGRYAPRTRFVEVFLNTNGGEVSQGDYYGVYTLVEKIKRGNDRVDVDKLSKNYDSLPLISGGYIFKIDRQDPDDSGFTVRGQQVLYVEPKEIELREAIRQPQRQFLQDYFENMVDSLTNPDPLTGYPSLIDVDSWIDYHLVQVLTNNLDTFRFSVYLMKQREGRLELGPLWDYDRMAGGGGCKHFCRPTGWEFEHFSRIWWDPLFDDDDYRQQFIDRYQELREDLWRTGNFNAIVSSLAAQLTGEAAGRNFERWGDSGWLGHVKFMRQWYEDRMAWIDDQFIPRPIVTPSAGAYLGGPIQFSDPLPPGSLAFDFGPAGSPVLDGFIEVGDEPFDEGLGYGWTAGTVNLADRETSNSLWRDLADITSPSATFSVNLDSGSYDVTVLMGDSSDVRDQMQLRFEPGEASEVQDAVTATPDWNYKQTYTIEVSDGRLDLELSDLGGISTSAVINGLVITSSDTGNGLVPAGTTFTLSLPDDAPAGAKVYYTLDGTDPRISIIDGGSADAAPDRLSSSAIEYQGEVIAIDGPGTIQARTFLPNSERKFLKVNHTIDWSGVAVVSVNIEAPQLAISEINYHPHDPTPAELQLEPDLTASDFEFIELKNIGSGPVDLNGYSITGGVEFTFPSVRVEAGDYVLVVRNPAAFPVRYGADKPVAGAFSGGLSNRTDQLVLSRPGGEVVLSFAYEDDDPWPARADGVGATLELIDEEGTPAEQYGKYYRWQGSIQFGGSPGQAGEGSVGVVVSEVFTRDDPTEDQRDAIELFNTTAETIDIGGWYLSDSSAELLKYQIPAGTTIPAGGYLVFDESHFNPTPDSPAPKHFGLSGTRGDDVWLVEVDAASNVARFVDDVHFGASLADESFGRISDASGRLVPTKPVTLGAANDAARVGPVVISEIHYHPGPPTSEALGTFPNLDDNDLEYVEIHNPTAEPVDLVGWQLAGGIEFTFGVGAVLSAGEALVVVSFDPDRGENADRVAALRQQYALDPGVALVGGYNGRLSNSGEPVRLLRVDPTSGGNATSAALTWEDETVYDDLPPWPTEADGGGQSLVRSSGNSPGHLAESWQAADPSPGVHEVVFAGDLDGDGDIDFDDIDDLLLALNDRAAYEAKFGISALLTADLNHDGEIDDDDIVAWVNKLRGA